MSKNNLHILFIGLIFLASCGSGLSEEEKIAIENSEENWNTNYKMADYLNERILKIDKIRNTYNDSLALVDSNNTDPINQKELYFQELDKLKKQHTIFILDLQKEDKAWANFKNKAMRSEVSSSDLEIELTKKHRAYFDYQKRISKLIAETEGLLYKIKK